MKGAGLAFVPGCQCHPALRDASGPLSIREAALPLICPTHRCTTDAHWPLPFSPACVVAGQ